MKFDIMKDFKFNSKTWIRIALINLLVVALAGTILRYKINFPLPNINQKFLLHGHSHFAFVGWITLALMALMVNHIVKSGVATNYRKYQWLLIANTVTAYGMLVSFILQGYALFSITFSSLSIFVSYCFIYQYWKDLNKIKQQNYISNWFKSALILWSISSIGVFGLAYLMASHNLTQELYFASIYLFLHFQYNGWFIFSAFGLLFSFIKTSQQTALVKINKGLFRVMVITVTPSYLLSILGHEIPTFLYWLGAISAVFQLGALYYGFKLLQIIQSSIIQPFEKMTILLWSLAGTSIALKITLQALSIFPYFGEFAFSLRPVIIGYLHLCFLGVISFFILGYFNELLSKMDCRLNKTGLLIFISGVILQEVVLMIQASDAILGQNSLKAPVVLFITAITMTAGLAMMCNTKLQKA